MVFYREQHVHECTLLAFQAREDGGFLKQVSSKYLCLNRKLEFLSTLDLLYDGTYFDQTQNEVNELARGKETLAAGGGVVRTSLGVN